MWHLDWPDKLFLFPPNRSRRSKTALKIYVCRACFPRKLAAMDEIWRGPICLWDFLLSWEEADLNEVMADRKKAPMHTFITVQRRTYLLIYFCCCLYHCNATSNYCKERSTVMASHHDKALGNSIVLAGIFGRCRAPKIREGGWKHATAVLVQQCLIQGVLRDRARDRIMTAPNSHLCTLCCWLGSQHEVHLPPSSITENWKKKGQVIWQSLNLNCC